MTSEELNRTIEFILNSQARAEARTDKLDRRVDGIAKILQQGMRMLAKTDATLAELAATVGGLAGGQKRTDAALAELAQAHKATERSLKAFIDSMRHGRNGR